MERLFVDVDETLVFHNGCCEAPQVLSTIHNIWDDEFNHPLLRNQRLADAIIKWQKDNDERKVFVWSANGDAWAATAATAFFPTEETFVIGTIFVAVTAPFVCFPSICIWAIFGSSIKLIIQNTKIKKTVEYLLALLLVVTAVIIVID